MKRILAMLLSVICALSFTCVSTYADEKSEDEEKAASIAESYLSAAAKNMWLYESNNLAEHQLSKETDDETFFPSRHTITIRSVHFNLCSRRAIVNHQAAGYTLLGLRFTVTLSSYQKPVEGCFQIKFFSCVRAKQM